LRSAGASWFRRLPGSQDRVAQSGGEDEEKMRERLAGARAGAITRNQAVEEIACKFGEFVDTFEVHTRAA
jgi:hypothetical protein